MSEPETLWDQGLIQGPEKIREGFGGSFKGFLLKGSIRVTIRAIIRL